jgi:crossover junction endodeoxyribonuclease RuvC
MKTIIGIDPGVTGAVAQFYGSDLVALHDLPIAMEVSKKTKKRLDIRAFATLIKFISRDAGAGNAITAYMEQAQAMPGQGVSSMFGYGRTNGIIEGVLVGLGIERIIKVPPAVWKRRLNLLSNAHPKDAGLQKARELYPHAELHLKKHHNRADAILIGHYGCQMEGLVK